MDPDSNRFVPLTEDDTDRRLGEALESAFAPLLRPDGTPVPKHWSVFRVGEDMVVKDYTFRVAYVGETSILLEPVGPVVIGEETNIATR